MYTLIMITDNLIYYKLLRTPSHKQPFEVGQYEYEVQEVPL